MILSYFIRDTEIHIATSEFSNTYEVTEKREIADKIVLFIKDAISNNKNQKLEQVIYSSGPSSFTGMRVINSIVKGILITDPTIDTIGVSSFLTYLLVSSKFSPTGLIAISNMRGEYFTNEYIGNVLKKEEIQNLESIQKYSESVFLETDETFNNINLANCQLKALNSTFATKNPKYIKRTLDVDYGFTPQYNCNSET